METTRKRRWWQFGIRDSLWLTMVVAVSVGWWVRERGFQRQQTRLQAELDRHVEWTETYRQMGKETGGFASPEIEGHYWRVFSDGHAMELGNLGSDYFQKVRTTPEGGQVR